MLSVPIYNLDGQKIGDESIDPADFGGEVNKQLLHDVVVMHLANRRVGTVNTRGRADVAGSGKKMFRQKGTGNARTGGIRNPIKKGGGHAKQKRPKDWRQDMPKKARQLATKSALLMKFQADQVRVVDNIAVDAPKTKVVAAMYKALGIDRSCLFALTERNANLEKSARNIDRTTLTTVAKLNAWDILKHRTLLMTRSGVQQLMA